MNPFIIDPAITAPPRGVNLASELFSRAIHTSVTVPRSKDVRWLNEKLVETRLRIKSLTTYLKPGNHFGVENPRITVPNTIASLKILEKHLEMSVKGWTSLLHPSFLSWMRPDGPQFMVTTWDSPAFSLSVENTWERTSFNTTPFLVPELAAQYYPAIKKLQLFLRGNTGTATITAEYTGGIPKKTFERMALASESKLFDCFYVAASAPEQWVVNTSKIADGDPIVFAGVSLEEDIPMQFFVIDVFEPSPAERVALQRHATEI